LSMLYNLLLFFFTVLFTAFPTVGPAVILYLGNDPAEYVTSQTPMALSDYLELLSPRQQFSIPQNTHKHIHQLRSFKGMLKSLPFNPLGSSVFYYGGSVTILPTIYLLYIGNEWQTGDMEYIEGFINGLTGSHYYNIMTDYYNSTNYNRVVHVQDRVNLAGTATMSQLSSNTIADVDFISIISAVISARQFETGDHVVYIALLSPDVEETSGHCTRYCSFHAHQSMSLSTVTHPTGGANGDLAHYIAIPSPARCPNDCNASGKNMDAMLNLLMHHLVSLVLNPDGKAWKDAHGFEIGDKCIWDIADVNVGGQEYRVQRQWVNTIGRRWSHGFCGVHK